MTSMRNVMTRFMRSGFALKYIGKREFYAAVLALIIPVIIQNSISNFVNLLDNVMVGMVSLEQMNGVSIANQLVFVFNLCIFGGVSAPGIFGAQFYGNRNHEGVRNSFRFSLYVAAVVSILGAAIFFFLGEKLVNSYIHDAKTPESAQEMLRVGTEYIHIMILGLLPFGVSQAYAGILRVTGETKLPMFAAVASVITNLVMNAVLIFGLFGFPEMKARGAAVATVISRYVELLIIVVCAHRQRVKHPTVESFKFLEGAYKSMRIPASLVKSISVRGLPLLANEAMWSLGMTMLTNLYSRLGTHVISANTITSTLTNLFNVFFISMGTAASVMVGQALGKNDVQGAKKNVRQIIFFQIVLCITIGLVMFLVSPLLPYCFREADADIRAIAANMLRICAVAMPINGFVHCAYFILRSGGRTLITFLFDSAYTWFVPVPLVFALVTYTELEIVPIYILCHAADLIKMALGYILLKKGVWIRNIVS